MAQQTALAVMGIPGPVHSFVAKDPAATPVGTFTPVLRRTTTADAAQLRRTTTADGTQLRKVSEIEPTELRRVFE